MQVKKFRVRLIDDPEMGIYARHIEVQANGNLAFYDGDGIIATFCKNDWVWVEEEGRQDCLCQEFNQQEIPCK